MLSVSVSAVLPIARADLERHTSIFNARYDAYLWPIVIVWALDRGLRLLRLICCNLQVRFSKKVISRTYTIASYSKESDVIRLDVRTDSFLATPAAGQFYYLYQPTTWQGYENHPFTLGAWSSSSIGSDEAGSSLLRSTGTHDDFDEEDGAFSASKRQSHGQTLTFWIRPYDGWTKRLRDSCLASPTHTTSPTIILEGPYGHHCPIATFGSVLSTSHFRDQKRQPRHKCISSGQLGKPPSSIKFSPANYEMFPTAMTSPQICSLLVKMTATKTMKKNTM